MAEILTTYDLAKHPYERAVALARPDADLGDVRESVREIISDVRLRGDAALIELTSRFDGVELDVGDLRVAADELGAAFAGLDAGVRSALELAADRIRAYESRGLEPPAPFSRDGVVVHDREIPVARAGIYVPGGLAAYPSTVLMTAISAQVAGVPEIALCVPPAPDGTVPVLTAAAAHMLGLGEVYRVGGAQAIAALAYGTGTIRSVDKIVGPGNIYVAVAKSEVSVDVGVESVAGPSECVVVADPGAPAEVVAVDLVAQAEHGPGGFCVLVTWSDALAAAVQSEVAEVVAASPRRTEIESTLEAGGRVLLCRDAEEALEVTNELAAEHVQLMVADPEALVPEIINAGAVFCGYDTPVTLGDYIAGPSHVLPTGGTARFASALRPADFTRSVHFVTARPDGLAVLGPAAMRLAEAEGLDTHADAVRVRLRSDDDADEDDA